MNELSIQIKYYDFTIHLSIEKVWIRPSAMALLATFRSYFPLFAKLQVKWGISLALKWKLNLFLSFGFHFWVFVLNWKASYCHLERCCQGCRTALTRSKMLSLADDSGNLQMHFWNSFLRSIDRIALRLPLGHCLLTAAMRSAWNFYRSNAIHLILAKNLKIV